MLIENSNVYVVIVTYNGMKWIDSCIQSCYKSTIPVQVVVVDNCSLDGTPDFLQKEYTNVTLIRQSSNLGFGQANNVGIKYALSSGAEYICLLNQDAYIHADALAKLISVFSKHKQYGVLSPIQMNANGVEMDKNFAANVFDPKNCPGYTEDLSKNIHKEVYTVNFIMAAIWLIRSDAIRNVGYFSPIFHHYGEDCDYLNRVRFSGLEVGIVPNSIGYHDREQRVVDQHKQLTIDYAGILSELTNINSSLLGRFGYATKFYFLSMVKYMLSGNLQLVLENNRLFFKQLTLIPRIFETRRKNRRIHKWQTLR